MQKSHGFVYWPPKTVGLETRWALSHIFGNFHLVNSRSFAKKKSGTPGGGTELRPQMIFRFLLICLAFSCLASPPDSRPNSINAIAASVVKSDQRILPSNRTERERLWALSICACQWAMAGAYSPPKNVCAWAMRPDPIVAFQFTWESNAIRTGFSFGYVCIFYSWLNSYSGERILCLIFFSRLATYLGDCNAAGQRFAVGLVSICVRVCIRCGMHLCARLVCVCVCVIG